MKNIVVFDDVTGEMFAIEAEEYCVDTGKEKLVIGGFSHEFVRSENVLSSQVPGGEVTMFRFKDTVGQEFLVIGEKAEKIQ